MGQYPNGVDVTSFSKNCPFSRFFCTSCCQANTGSVPQQTLIGLMLLAAVFQLEVDPAVTSTAFGWRAIV